MEFKKLIIRFFFLLEICLFSYWHFIGSNGLPLVHAQQKETSILSHAIQGLHKDVYELKQSLAQWDKYPFYKEQYAREELQMAHPHEHIYLYAPQS